MAGVEGEWEPLGARVNSGELITGPLQDFNRSSKVEPSFTCLSLSESGLCSVSCLGHSMMDTLAVALRVAEEAIEEAICKAEAYGDSLV